MSSGQVYIFVSCATIVLAIPQPNKMKTKLFFIILFSAIINANCQTSVPGGSVSGIWNIPGSPYLVQGSVFIPQDSTLIIQPGVRVDFQGTYKFLVLGQLIAIGASSDTITFTATDTSNGWLGIRFDNTPIISDTSKFIFCKLEYGKATNASPDDKGGAFYFDNFSKVIVSNSSINYCTSSALGGGTIYCANSSPKINNNNISFNSPYDGGISCHFNSNPTISSNSITNNTASANGGSGILCVSSNPTITGNIISHNTSSDCNGGGIWCNSSSPLIANNTISNNSSSQGGGIYCLNSSNPYIINNTLTNNSASYGGGIYCNNSQPILTNNTIVNNSSTNGGGLYCNGASDPIFRNSILYGNSASMGGAQVFIEDEPSDPDFYYCNVEGSSVAFDANFNIYTGVYQNNIDATPFFALPSGGNGTGFNGATADWSLQNTSSCIDSGDPIGTYPTTDKAGNPRVVGSYIDIGAYEYQASIGISQLISQNNFIIYPNPTNGEFFVDMNPTNSLTLDIFDFYGKHVFNKSISDHSKINVTYLKDGVYNLSIKTADRTINKKLVIVR